MDEGNLVGIDLGSTEEECEWILADSEHISVVDVRDSDEREAGSLAVHQANPLNAARSWSDVSSKSISGGPFITPAHCRNGSAKYQSPGVS